MGTICREEGNEMMELMSDPFLMTSQESQVLLEVLCRQCRLRQMMLEDLIAFLGEKRLVDDYLAWRGRPIC